MYQVCAHTSYMNVSRVSTSQPVCQYYIHVCTPQGTPQGTGGYLSLYTFLQCVESVFSLPLHIVHFTRQTFNILLASGHTSERILSAARVMHCVYTWHSKYSSKYSFRVLSDTCFTGLVCHAATSHRTKTDML